MNKAMMCAGLLSLAGIFAGLLAGPAAAHGLWVEERRGNLEVIYGHGAEDNAYDPKKINAALAFDRAGKAVPAEVKPLQDHGRVEADNSAAMVVVTLDNGYWTSDAQGAWHNKGRSAVADAKESGRYTKTAVMHLKPGATIPDLKRLDLVIVPLRDPLSVHPGEALPVRVMMDGKPAAGVALIGDYVNDPEHEVATTDEKGEARVTIRNAGLNVIAASASVPTDDPEADVRGMLATLAFVSSLHQH